MVECGEVKKGHLMYYVFVGIFIMNTVGDYIDVTAICVLFSQ